MSIVPIVFAFDNNLAMSAAVCLYSLFANAMPTTVYDVFILHRQGKPLDMQHINKVMAAYPKHKLSLIEVGGDFDSSFEIRGITTPAYYRLLIPNLISQYSRVIYSDVDVIFRQDLSSLYHDTDMDGCYIAGVNDLANIDADLQRHYKDVLHLNDAEIICSGFLLMDLKKLREDNMVGRLVTEAQNRYKYQDQDVLNIVCQGHIRQLAPKYSLLTYISRLAVSDEVQRLKSPWTLSEIDEAVRSGNIHYNGQKPWRGYCVNFDVWWEYYRKSPVFDPKFYFDFFYERLDELDRLPLWKRIKILVRFFVYGRKK